MEERDIDRSEVPEVEPQAFARALVRKGLRPVPPKEQVTLRLDAEVLAWFRAQGRGYQSRMNAILKAFKEAHEESARR
jgi:uncharacterized protein (DUF4415 family)